MAMFDYKQYSSAEAARLMSVSHKLAVYTNVSPKFISGTLNALGKLAGNYLADRLEMSPPDGWRALEPSELGLPANSVDPLGFYTVESPLTGHNTIPGMGPQLKIFGKFNDVGKVTALSIGFCGTNDPLDIVDYVQLNSGEMAPKMEPILQVVKNYAEANGLSGSDVLVTGYSLGGAMTNLMAKYRETLADGFFADADYIGHASPLIYDNPSVILNAGFENDVVYRAAGDAPTLGAAVAAAKPGLVNPDKPFATTMDNVVLFNDTYASPLWKISPFSLINIPTAWSAHIDGLLGTPFTRIANSSYYEYTAADSTVVVDYLTGLTRATTWVEDKASHTSGHYGTPAFIIGSDRDNLLKGGVGGDYIDAGAGNDKIKTGTGADRIDGGEGVDTLILSGRRSDWNVYRTADGDVFFHAKDGSGLKQAENIEKVSFEGEWRTTLNPFEVGTYGLTDKSYPVLKFLNQDVAYGRHQEGSAGNDVLKGKTLFGGAGNDVLTAAKTSSLLHGGEGNDMLFGGRGNDELYGAEGNDFLYGGQGGRTVMSGGVGNDVFAFDKASRGIQQISDFNHYAGDKDKLVFDSALFSGRESVLAAARQQGSDVVIGYKGGSIVLKGTELAALDSSYIEIV
ncbi:calcium-binding protein [Neisseria leonii]|uniref:calcium-binding protein n=1 Tax=Neisseria leonii TaxID=2995413 RepID=UPI00237C1602|nr:calcium-binding protein [Neisseria sp. 3986]MDD9326105.1 hypothetical protein [Neisseria sp. 3986]